MTHFFIDFDSTIIAGELMDILADIALENNPRKTEICAEITAITNQGMLGEISFSESLSKRISLLHAHQSHFEFCVTHAKTLITPSFQDFCHRMQTQGNNIAVVSGGFKEFIEPILENIIKPSNIYANNFCIDINGFITGADTTNPLAHSQGKVNIIQSLQKSGTSIMIGDGFTDYETKFHGAVDKFRYYAEHVQRISVMQKSERVIQSFDEI